MARKNIPQIDALVQRTFAQKMWDNEFHPYKDHTEWLRLVDGNILQTVLFYEYLTIDLRVEYYAQPLSEYLWCNYRQPNIRGYIAGYFCDMMGRYKLGDPEMCRIAGPYGGTRVWMKSQDLYWQMECALDILNEVRTAADILKVAPAEHDRPERPCLRYEIGDEAMTWAALKNSTYINKRDYDQDVPPEKLKRDYWRVWEPKTAFVARDCLAKGSLQPLADFAEESREFNLKYLKRYMPWLLQ